MAFNHFPLQKAIYQALTADAALMGLVTNVYDRPPQNSAFPYVTLGDATARDWSSKTTTGVEHTIALRVWGREGGRKEASLIMERIHTLLHQANLSVTGHTLVMIRFVSSDITLENDGWTYQGAMRFQALLQKN